MVAKNNTKRTTADKTTKRHQTKVAKDEAPPGESSAQAEPVVVEAAEAPNAPTTEKTTPDGPMPAEAVTIGSEQTPADEYAKRKKLSALDAAARVLEESGQAMNCQELIAAMAAKGYWSSPNGRTPSGTLYSAVLREIQTRGDRARFRKTERGKFALRENVQRRTEADLVREAPRVSGPRVVLERTSRPSGLDATWANRGNLGGSR